MKKIISSLLAAIMVAGSITAVSADAPTASLYKVEDFEHCAVGAYSGDIVDLSTKGLSPMAGGITLEVVQEAGNKFLKATVPNYAAFGYYFGTGDNRKYAYMTFDYKFPTSEGNGRFATYANPGTQALLNGDASNGWEGSAYSVGNGTATEWTQASGLNYTNAYSACIGIGHNQYDGTKVIYIDNIVVWEFDQAVGTTHNSAVPATVTFANSTGNEGSITMPNAFNGIAWCNLYGAQGSNCTINLNNYKPTGAPQGKKFAGWSLSDGGNKIKDTMYSSFKIPSSITLYAVWEDLSVTAKKEDFERFAENQVLTNDDFTFLFQFPFVTTSTATVKVDENGNKYLRIEGPMYTGFKVNKRPTDAGTEYLKFNYRFTSATGSRFTIFSGTDHTGSNQIGRLTRTTDWTNNIIAFDTTKVTVGGFFDESATNCVIELDDVYYWYIPDGKTKTITTTFANSTVNAPTEATLPNAVTRDVWTSPSTKTNSIFLPDVIAADPSGQYQFAGWSRTDGGKIINSIEESYCAVCDETLYAVWKERTAPTVCSEVTLRNDSKYKGLRFKAFVTDEQRGYADEYGFIIAKAENVSVSTPLTFNLTINDRTKKPFVTGVAYKKSTGLDNVFDADENIYFTALLTDITDARANDVFVARPYLKIGSTVLYGDTVQAKLSDFE